MSKKKLSISFDSSDLDTERLKLHFWLNSKDNDEK